MSSGGEPQVAASSARSRDHAGQALDFHLRKELYRLRESTHCHRQMRQAVQHRADTQICTALTCWKEQILEQVARSCYRISYGSCSSAPFLSPMTHRRLRVFSENARRASVRRDRPYQREADNAWLLGQVAGGGERAAGADPLRPRAPGEPPAHSTITPLLTRGVKRRIERGVLRGFLLIRGARDAHTLFS